MSKTLVSDHTHECRECGDEISCNGDGKTCWDGGYAGCKHCDPRAMTRDLEKAHAAEVYLLQHDWSYSQMTGDAKCKTCGTFGIGDGEDMCDGPKVWGLWWGGSSFSQGSVDDDLEEFTGLRYAKEAMEERFNASRYPATMYPVDKPAHNEFLPGVSGSTMTLWFYDPRGERDPYPDLLLQQGDNDTITEELT